MGGRASGAGDLQLATRENEPLLLWWNTGLLLDLFLDARNLVVTMHDITSSTSEQKQLRRGV